MALQHIGIVGCSAEGAALCYKTICVEGAGLLGGHAHPEVSMHTPNFADYVDCLDQGDIEGVGALMLKSAEKLAGAGADFLICPDNTIHQAMGHVRPRSPLPWLHIAEVVAEEAAVRGYQRLAVTGTQWLVTSEVYPAALAPRGIEAVRPNATEIVRIDRIIMDELVRSVFKPESTAAVLDVLARMRDEDCDAAILGCTELPLIVDEGNAPLPVLDSTRLLARAALRRAIGTAAETEPR